MVYMEGAIVHLTLTMIYHDLISVSIWLTKSCAGKHAHKAVEGGRSG